MRFTLEGTIIVAPCYDRPFSDFDIKGIEFPVLDNPGDTNNRNLNNYTNVKSAVARASLNASKPLDRESLD